MPGIFYELSDIGLSDNLSVIGNTLVVYDKFEYSVHDDISFRLWIRVIIAIAIAQHIQVDLIEVRYLDKEYKLVSRILNRQNNCIWSEVYNFYIYSFSHTTFINNFICTHFFKLVNNNKQVNYDIIDKYVTKYLQEYNHASNCIDARTQSYAIDRIVSLYRTVYKL